MPYGGCGVPERYILNSFGDITPHWTSCSGIQKRPEGSILDILDWHDGMIDVLKPFDKSQATTTALWYGLLSEAGLFLLSL